MCKACSSPDGALEIKNAFLKGDREAINKALGVETQSYFQDSYATNSLYL